MNRISHANRITLHTHHTHHARTHALQGKSRRREKLGYRIGWERVNGWWLALMLVLLAFFRMYAVLAHRGRQSTTAARQVQMSNAEHGGWVYGSVVRGGCIQWSY